MCAFEEQIKKKFKQTKNVIKVLFTGRWIVICAIHRWIVLFRQMNETMEIVFLLQ
jgi:hypothetical protein